MAIRHPIWNEIYINDEIPVINFRTFPGMEVYEQNKPDIDSVVVIYEQEKGTWDFYTFLKEGEVLTIIDDTEELKQQVLKFIRNIASSLSGLASYAEIIGAVRHNQSGIRKYCDLQAVYNNIIKEVEWFEENYPKEQNEEIEELGLLTYTELPEGISIENIIVKNEFDKEQLLKALKYMHDRRDIDTGLAAVDALVHLYQRPNNIINIIPTTFATGSSFIYDGEEYTLVYTSSGRWQWMDNNNEFCLDGTYDSTSSVTIKELEAMSKTLKK